MKFFSRTDKPGREFTPSGGKTSPEYALELDSEGNEHLVICGEVPNYDIIQASAEGASISHIITRWRAGDESVLNKASGVYGDFTNIPDNLAASQQAIINAQNLFNSLPLSEREKFGMNLTTFLHAVSSGEFEFKSSDAKVSITPTAPTSSKPAETITIDGVKYSINQEVIDV